MSRFVAASLGIVTALGGFVDVGEIVFATQAGARFGYHLVWPVVLGAMAVAVYAEMCGRVAIVTGKPVFVVVRERLGLSLGFCTLVSSTALNVLTCAAEVGGVAIAIRLLTHLPFGVGAAITILVLVTIVSVLPFDTLERVFGFTGLLMLVFVAAAVALGIDWPAFVAGFVPNVPQGTSGGALLSYAYFAVGLMAATVMPYEVQFYSSGEIEEGHDTSHLGVNAITAVVGFGFGSIVTISIIVLGAQVFQPLGIVPNLLGSSAAGPIVAFGTAGLLAAVLGALFAIGGAAVETSLSGAYAIAQFFGFEWGMQRSPWTVPRFTVSWLVIFASAALILVTDVDPVELTEYAVIFSVLALPLTYAPVLLVARDRSTMGEHANSRVQDVVAMVFLLLIVVVAVTAVPFMYLSRMGHA